MAPSSQPLVVKYKGFHVSIFKGNQTLEVMSAILENIVSNTDCHCDSKEKCQMTIIHENFSCIIIN